MPCTGAGLERRTKVASGILQADVSWFGHSLFLSIPKGTSFPTKILPSSAAQQCWRPEASYTLHRTVPLSTCCWLGELVLLWCHPYINSTLRRAAAAQLVQCRSAAAVIKVEVKASKEVHQCTVLQDSVLTFALLAIPAGPTTLLPHPWGIPSSSSSFFVSQPLGLGCFLASSILVEGNLGYSQRWEMVTPFRVS